MNTWLAWLEWTNTIDVDETDQFVWNDVTEKIWYSIDKHLNYDGLCRVTFAFMEI